jgi:hypothetical protein
MMGGGEAAAACVNVMAKVYLALATDETGSRNELNGVPQRCVSGNGSQ